MFYYTVGCYGRFVHGSILQPPTISMIPPNTPHATVDKVHPPLLLLYKHLETVKTDKQYTKRESSSYNSPFNVTQTLLII